MTGIGFQTLIHWMSTSHVMLPRVSLSQEYRINIIHYDHFREVYS